MSAIQIIVHPKPNRQGHYDAYLGDDLLCSSRLPFFDGARALLGKGLPPTLMVTMRHHDRAYPSFVPMPLGQAAQLSVAENDASGPKLIKHKANPFAEAKRAARVEAA